MLSVLEKTEITNTIYCEEEVDVPTSEDFAYYLYNMRTLLNKNKLQMAELLHCNKNSYNSYESGKRLPRKWSEIQQYLNQCVKEHCVKMRQGNQQNHVTNELSEKIIALHFKGLNTVQIGIRLSIDEEEVAEYIEAEGYEPLLFNYI